MLAPFLIMLREGLEAALIVGIIASYLHQTGHRQWIPLIWVGIFLAAGTALFVGAALQFAGAQFPQRLQELFEAVIGFVAVFVLTTMVFWMRRAGRSMKRELQAKVDSALESSALAGWGLVGMAFLAVAREGLEAVFFLLAIFQQSPGPAAPLSALAGIAVSTLVGLGIFAFGLRLDLARIFKWTGVMILLVAAGVLAGALGNLHEAGIWNLAQAPVYDLSAVLPESSALGTILSGLLGYQEAPTIGQVSLYAAYLVVTVWLFLRPTSPSTPKTELSATDA